MKKQTEAYWGRWAFAGVMVFLFIICLISFAHGTTRYVKIGGNDTSAGTSWATAWATTGKVQSTLTGGDTVFFGTGTWRDVHFVPPKGSASDRTTYACSSFVQGIAHLWGSEQLSTWVQYGGSGNRWAAHFTGTNCWIYGRAYTCTQNDSLLDFRETLAAVNSVGEFFHNTTNDSIYVWCYGNANPNNRNMEASCHEIFDFEDDNTGYTTVYGFDIRYGAQGIIVFNGLGDTEADSVLISHCNISGTSYIAWENPSCIFSGKGGSEATASTWGKDNVVRACSLQNYVDWTGSNHGDGAVLYTQTRFVVESCYVDGRSLGNVGLFAKNETQYCVFRYNLLTDINVNAMRVAYSGQYDSFYGNTVIGNGTIPYDGANLTENPQASPFYSRYCAWLNNTFINCGTATGINTGYDDGGGTGHLFKYNLLFDSIAGGNIGRFEAATKARWTIDSNLIYRNAGYGSGSFYYNGDRTLAYWRATVGFDGNSDTTYAHIKFNNASANDFSRPTSSAEMNQTYGGRTWTRYGAWQPSGTDDSLIQHLTPPTPLYPVNGSMIWGDKIDNLWGPPTDSVALIVGTFNSYDSLFFKAYFIQADSGGLSATGLLENTTYYYASIAIEGSHRDTTAIASLTTTSGQTADRNKIRRLFTKLKE